MKSFVLSLVLVLGSSGAQAAQYLCTQKGGVRPIYITLNAPEARITIPPSFEQVVLTLLSKPSDLPSGYVAEYEGRFGCTKAGFPTCKAIEIKNLMVSKQVANGELRGYVRYDGTRYKCFLGIL